jgi:hypothetical protein
VSAVSSEGAMMNYIIANDPSLQAKAQQWTKGTSFAEQFGVDDPSGDFDAAMDVAFDSLGGLCPMPRRGGKGNGFRGGGSSIGRGKAPVFTGTPSDGKAKVIGHGKWLPWYGWTRVRNGSTLTIMLFDNALSNDWGDILERPDAEMPNFFKTLTSTRLVPNYRFKPLDNHTLGPHAWRHLGVMDITEGSINLHDLMNLYPDTHLTMLTCKDFINPRERDIPAHMKTRYQKKRK